jgi:hypothetical protein
MADDQFMEEAGLRPALTPEAEEQKLIALAVNLAKKQLLEGTASSQVITHYLKLASSREKLEQELLEEKRKLAAAKTDLIASEARQEELYARAISAFKRYRGEDDENI